MAASLHLPADVEALTPEQILALAARAVPRARRARVLVPEGGDGPPRHAVRARAEGARLRDRHAPSLPRDVRVLARGRAAIRHDDRGLRGPVAGGARGDARRAALGDEARPLPRDREGRAARHARSATSTPGSPGSAATSRRRAPTRRSSAGTSSTSSGRRTRSRTGATTMCWDYIRARGLPYNPLHDRGLRLDRRHALDAAGRRPLGPLGRHRQGRVRHPHGRSADVAGARRGARERLRRSGSPASRPPGKTTVGERSSRRELEQRGLHRRACSTATSCARISRRGSASRRRTATRTSRASAGSPRGSPAPAPPSIVSRDLAVRGDAPPRALARRAARARSSRSTSRRRSRCARGATRRASTQRRSPARSSTSPASPIRTRSRRTRSCASTPRAASPPESAARVLARLEELELVAGEVAVA